MRKQLSVVTQTVNKPHFNEVLHKQLLGFLLTVTIIFSKVLHGFLENIFQTWQKKKKTVAKEGVPYRFQGNEAIGTKTISSAGAPWGRNDFFRRAPVLLLQRIRSVHHEAVTSRYYGSTISG